MDRRLVQTAVVGGPDADLPVILPEDHRDLDEFRIHHADAGFFCGILLGGCDRPLTTKRYADRACHFAHLADPDGPSACSRGAHSADHLYLRRAVASWLAEHGHGANGDLHGTGRDAVVEFLLEAGVRLRFHLSAPNLPERAEAESQAARDGAHITWFLPPSPGAGLDPGAGAPLVRCQSAGTRAVP